MCARNLFVEFLMLVGLAVALPQEELLLPAQLHGGLLLMYFVLFAMSTDLVCMHFLVDHYEMR